MADAPWRCSQCGTVNEPVANSCRTCGKWPSLFDLQDSVVEDAEYDLSERRVGEPEPYVPDVFEPETMQTETFEPEPFEPEIDDMGEEEAEDSGRRKWTSALVPLALLVYFAISFFFSDR
ncbi:MAG: hypothetical protein M3364_06545 [Actinomycetota bacterium]|nr:hypothetical protein [Actinomycetota bacterium]